MRWNAIFADHMVLQRDKPIRVFGPGATWGTVRMAGAQAEIHSRGAGWMATLPAMPAGGPYTLEAGDGLIARDVYVGDVFLLAGQSNMQFRIEDEPEAAPVMDDPLVRCYGVTRPECESPTDEHWSLCEAEAGRHWSAIGVYLAGLWRVRENVAVGLVACFQGAAMIQPFLDEDRLAGSELELPDAEKHVDFRYFPLWNRNGLLYRSMFRTVAPYGFHHVLWYQGESNTSLAEGRIYDRMLAELCREWRADLQDDVPFVIVQIHHYTAGGIPEGWRLVREAQERAAMTISGCVLVKTEDLGEDEKIHPEHKLPVAERIFCAIQDSKKQ